MNIVIKIYSNNSLVPIFYKILPVYSHYLLIINVRLMLKFSNWLSQHLKFTMMPCLL